MAKTDLARLVVSLEAQNTQMLAKLEQAERKVASWERKTSKAVSGVSSAFKGLLAGGAVLSGFNAIAQATIESEKAIAQFESALASTGGAVGFTADELKGFASELQKTSTYGDEAIIGLETRLLSFGNVTGDVFKRATQATLDLSTRLGKDLNSSALLVGKALNDPVKGLSALARAGVQFSAQQREVIQSLAETGDLAGAQGIILDELSKKFGGAAQAARNTFGGALTGLKEAFGDLLESPTGMGAATESLNEFTRLLQDPGTMQAANTLTSSLVTGFSLVTEAIGGAFNGLVSLGKKLREQDWFKRQVDWMAAYVKQASELPKAMGLIKGPEGIGGIQSELSAVEGKIDALSFGKLSADGQKELDALRVRADELRKAIAAIQPVSPGIVAEAPAAPAPAAPASTPPLASSNRAAELMRASDSMMQQVEERLNERAKQLENVEQIKLSLLTDEQRQVAQLQAQYIELQNAVAAGAITQQESSAISAQLAQRWADAQQEANTAVVQELYSGLLTQEEEINNSYDRRLNAIMEAVQKQVLTEAQGQDAIARLRKDYDEKIVAATQEKTGEMSEFAKAAAQNMQSAFADFLFDPMKDGFDGMLLDFVNVLRRMAAEAVAAKIFDAIGGAIGGASGGTGGAFASLFSAFAGAKDSGGAIPSGQWGIAGERGPEIVQGPANVISRMDTARIFDPGVSEAKSSSNVRIVNAIDPKFIADYLASPDGDQVYLNLVSRNARKTRALVI